MDNYKTVHKQSETEFVEKKSRFLGYCKSVKTEDEAIEFINSIKAKNRQSKHGVYAYVLRESHISRYTDDGEPQGTAGVPILEIIQKENLTDVVIVVIRYFGGILLGTGGLVRAYSKSAKLSIEASEPTEMIFCKVYSVICDYTHYGKIEYLINQSKEILKDVIFENDVQMTVCIKNGNEKDILQKIHDISSGKAKITQICEEYIAKSIDIDINGDI